MTNKTKIKWRLSSLPDVDELRDLVKDKIITQDEAREILFNIETEEERDKKSLESEIKFLRELVETLTDDRSKIVKVIQTMPTSYYQGQAWYSPYYYWANGTLYTSSSNGTLTASNTGSSTLTSTTTSSGLTNFSSIQTF